MSNIVISSHWTDGDIIPFIRIGQMLKKRGHAVRIFTHCFYEKMACEAGLEFTAWDTPQQYISLIDDMSSYNENNAETEAIFEFRKKYENINIRLEEFNKIRQFCKKKDTVILAKNRSSIAAFMASELFECPLISFFMNPYEMESMLSFNHLYGNLLKDEANELRSYVGLPPIRSWLEWQSSPLIQLALWPSWFSGKTSEWPAHVKIIGFPLNSKQHSKESIPDSIIRILQDESSPILITGGTSKQLRPDFYKKAIEACKIVGNKTILVTRYKEFLPEVLPTNITWFQYVPLDDILPYMGAVIHHGGIGTVSGAINAATPQLALAYYVDRPLNARRVKNLGIGEYLPPLSWKPELIADKLKKILAPDYKDKCVDFTKEVPIENALQEVCKITESLAGKSEFAIKYKKNFSDTFLSNDGNLVQEINTPCLPQKMSNELKEILLRRKLSDS